MKILVTGAGGMLGSALIPEFRASGHSVVATDIKAGLPRLDVRSQDEIESAMDRWAPDLVIHLAAETSLEACDSDPDHAWSTNTQAVGLVARAAARRDALMVYVSTAGVFDGTKDEPYEENDQPNPINSYGRTKLSGEDLVATICDRYFIVRAGWMAGGVQLDHKFVGTIARKLQGGERTVYAVGDKYGSPTYSVDFSRCLACLVETTKYGLYHLVSGGVARRFDVAEFIIEKLGLTGQVDLVEVDSQFFAKEFSSPRPRSEAMRNAELERRGLNSMRPWPDALGEYLELNFAGRIRPAGRA